MHILTRKTPNNFGNNDVAILVPSVDLYSDLWHPFFRCFFKYWPDCPYTVYLGSNRAEYPDKRVRPVPIGEEVDYSSNLRKMLDHLPERWIILWIEDRVLSKKVDTPRVEDFVSYSLRKNAGYTKLISTHPYSFFPEEGPGVGEIPKGSTYRFGITVGLWRKNLLLEILSPGESVWQLEKSGSRRSNKTDEIYYALHYKNRFDPPIWQKHLIMKGMLIRNALGFLRKEGCEECLSNRRVQSLGSYYYLNTYLSVLDLFSWFRWKWKCLLF